ncbi:Prenylated Rab acceptor 1 [Talaromyces islandicus]|uniref:Prenylated Rab acceptor 1 n=1 Tax=Talaromyces islandicus TaxID=28573 RepID=A0A0U1LXY3_TALIS|nr:Prenylated Rab acceptor 1 [Talaromyces islandicus]
MARIQFPVDMITSRFGDRLNSIRSTSMSSRFASLKPVSEFLDIKRLSKPADFGEVQSRVNYNLSYFSSNYALVFVMLSIYSLLTNPVLLFVIIFVTVGLYGIGRLEGRDLDIGVARATTSQLYTGMLVIAVPLGLYASPITTVLWLIGATGVTVIGGRPRTPYDMPRWGRPPGVRNGKQARRRATQWEDFDGVRFEEIDGDDDGDDAVVLGSLQRHGNKGNTSTRELRLRNNGYDYDSELSDGEDFDLNDDADSTVAFAVQLALRDKEDMLVEKALERIRRAQMLGKKNVRLSQEELDALDRRRKQTANNTKKVSMSKATGFTRQLDGKRRKSGESSKMSSQLSSQAERRRSSQEQYLLDESSMAYARAPSTRPSSSSSRPRTPTMQSLRPQSSTNSPLSMHQPAYGQRFSDRDSLQPASPRDLPYMRALPDDPQWAPRQRSSSNTTPYPDNFMYQPYGLGPGDPRLNYSRRYGPGMPYPGYPPVSEEPSRGSSGRQTRAESSEEESSSEDEEEEDEKEEDEDEDSEEEEDDDDGEHGVQVEVVEQPPIRKPAARTAAPQKNKKKNNNNNSRPRRRNGR